MPAQPSRLSFDLADIGLPEVPLFGRYRYRAARQHLARHVHAGCFEFCYLAEGSQVFGVGGRDYVMRPGDVFLTFPEEPHGSAGHPMERGSLYWFHLHAPARRETYLDLSPQATAALHGELSRLPSRCFAAGEAVGRPLAMAFSAAQVALANPSAPLARQRVATPLVTALLALLEAAQRDTSRPQDSHMQRAIDYMERHVEQRLAIQDVAAAVGLSTSWFKARFRREVGMPPAEYLLRRKVDRACCLLGDSSLSITRIALRLGFSSSQHFASVIRRYTGKTPRDLRTTPSAER